MPKVSDSPWTKFSKADYSVEQWHRACLIHDHEGAATSKDQCQLPVREPDGTLNRAGVHAAETALSGKGLKIGVPARITANKAMKGYYTQLGEKPPAPKLPAFLKHDEMRENFLQSMGVTLNHDDASKSINSGLVIVAIPRDGDLVRAVGTEEKHATLLFLGDNVSDEVTALIQASIQDMLRTAYLAPFVETVSSVSSLGPDGARVWMIDSNSGLRNLRDRLLRLPAIRALYDTVEQFPNYTPHVTVGYPVDGQKTLTDFEETQAKLVRRIEFDRIALWHGDNHNIGWRLPKPSDDANVMHAEDAANNFLEHHGIKGMRWGFRRERGSDGTVAGGVKEEASSGGTAGGDSSGHISVDAERFAKTSQKSIHEMSDREIKEANARAEAIKKYNDIFAPGTSANAELKAKVDALRLQKDYNTLKKELTPPSTMQKFVKTAGLGFHTFQKLDKDMNGLLSNGLANKLGMKPHLTVAQKLAAETANIKSRTDNARAKIEAKELEVLKGHIIRGDAPSKAPLYTQTGKHRQGGRHSFQTD